MSAPTSSAAAAAPAAPAAALPLPQPAVLLQAAKLAQQLDRPIQLDYYADSATGKAVIGEDPDSKDKLLIKSNDEYTSQVQKVYKVGDDYLILTENSIYIVSGKIGKRKLNMSQLFGADA